MEKATQATIGGVTFSVTEAAFSTLARYLERLTAHFAHDADHAEILRDIESRIAEKLAHKKGEVILESDMNAVIADIGEAAELDGDTEAPARATATKKLYRDMDNAYLGGVCAGLGAYFDVDALYFRIAFLISLLFGGAGVVLYLILLLLIPEAKSSSQKLEMHGRPVNLEGIAQIVKERVEDTRVSGTFARVAHRIRSAVRALARIFGSLFGALLTLGSFAGIFALILGLGIILTNWSAPYNDFPLRDGVSDGLLFIGMAFSFVAVLLPLVLVFSLGIRLMRRRAILPSAVGFGLVGLWALAAIGTGVTATKIAGDYYTYTSSAPQYQHVTKPLDLPTFTAIDVSGEHITVRNSAEPLVEVEGRQNQLDRISAKVENGVLKIRRVESARMCLFCDNASPSIVVGAPQLASLSVAQGSVQFDDFEGGTFNLSAENASIWGKARFNALTLTAERANIDIDIAAQQFSFSAGYVQARMRGSVVNASLTLHDASVEAGSLHIGDATLAADDSDATLWISGEIRTSKDDSSVVRVEGGGREVR